MIKPIVLDICKHERSPTQTIVLRQGDQQSTILNITITENDTAFDVTNYEARFMASLPNGSILIAPCEKIDKNRLSFSLPSALTICVGTMELVYVALYQGDNWIASTNTLTIQVQPAIDVDAKEAENWLPEFVSLHDQLSEIVQMADKQKTDQQTSWEKQMTNQQTTFQQAESDRVAAENVRKTEETKRNASESTRLSEEAKRSQAETSRASAEKARTSAEDARKTSESTRIAAETARVTAESSRSSAENTRNSAETSRVSAERQRAAAEVNRENAEAKREEDVAAAIQSLQELPIITNEEIDALW